MDKPWAYFHDLWLQAKWFWQRGTKGYSDRDTWSVDWYLCSFMGNALRELAESKHGVPARCIGRHQCTDNPNDCEFFTVEEWRATILYIAETFDIGHKVQDCDYMKPEEYEWAYKRFKHGMGMFTEYFFNLWD